MKILYIFNCSEFPPNFLPLAIAAKHKGYDVVMAGNNNQQKIESLGLSFVEYRFSRSG